MTFPVSSQMMTPTFLGALLPADRREIGKYPSVALTNRFKVTLGDENGTMNLGRWATCGGLKVEFKTKIVEEGGEYGFAQVLPERVQYPHLVLTRAMTHLESTKIQQWLTQVEQKWVNSDGTGAPYQPTTATVTLYDYHADKNKGYVLSWTFDHVYPVSWSAPDLDASSSKVAMERLELEHHGFLGNSTPSSTGR